MRWRLTLFELILLIGLIGLLLPWPFQIGPGQISSADLSALLFGLALGTVALSTGSPRLSLGLLLTLLVFLLWQMWSTAAWLAHPYGRGPVQLIWHIYKNVWIFLPMALMGVMIGGASDRTRRMFAHLVIGLSAVSAAIGLLQTLTGGRMLSGLLTNERFLGLLTPLPGDLKASLLRDMALANMAGNESIFIGPVFRAHGPFLHPNPYSSMLAAAAAFTLAYAFPPGQAAQRRFVVALAVIIAAMLASIGIAGYTAVLAVIGYTVLTRTPALLHALRRPQTIVIGALAAVVLVGGIASLPQWSDRLPAPLAQRLNRLVRPDQSGGFNGRFAAWSVVLQRIEDSPVFGTGRPVTLREAGWLPSDTALGAHNAHLVVALYTGLPGLLLYLLLLSLFLRASWVASRRLASPDDRTLAFACHLLVVALAVVGIAQDWVVDGSIAGLFWLCGMASVALFMRRPRTHSAPVTAVERPLTAAQV